jgi:protein-arginine kinase activator protein McsA
MHRVSILPRIESLRKESFYRTVKRDSFEENVAHTRREIRLLEMQAELQKLQRP